MKNNLINRVSLVAIIIIGLFIYSCNVEDENALSPMEENYSFFLDLDVENLSYLSTEENTILEQARQRINNHVIVENDRFALMISSGKDINVSDRLFQSLIGAIGITNEKLSRGEFFFFKGKLLSQNSEIENLLPRVKTRQEGNPDKYQSSTNYYWWGEMTTTKFDQNGALDYYSKFNNEMTAAATVASLISWGFGFISTAPGQATGALALGLSYYGTSTGNAILEAARKGSITISSQRNYVVPPGSPAASVNFVYDCYGNLVATIY